MKYELLQYGLRARLVTLEVCATGLVSLAATATGYTRASGSFLDDGFRVGMEIEAAGFAQAACNGTSVITAVTALTMTVTAYDIAAVATPDGYTMTPRTLVVDAAAGSRSLTAGCPKMRAWENTRFTPLVGIPYVSEELLPGGMNILTMGTRATLEAKPIYVVRWHGLPGDGIAAVKKAVDKLLEHFPPGLAIAFGTDVARVRGDIAPTPSPLVLIEDGPAVTTCSIPLRCQTLNAA
jgi:hypothetical protein